MGLAPSSLIDTLVRGRRDKGLKRLVREEELERLFVENATRPHEAEIGQFSGTTQEKLLQGDFRGAAVAEAEAEEKSSNLAFESLRTKPPPGTAPHDILRESLVGNAEMVLSEDSTFDVPGNPLTRRQAAENLFQQPEFRAPSRTLAEAQSPVTAGLGDILRPFVEPIDPETGMPNVDPLPIFAASRRIVRKGPKAIGDIKDAAHEAAQAFKGARRFFRGLKQTKLFERFGEAATRVNFNQVKVPDAEKQILANRVNELLKSGQLAKQPKLTRPELVEQARRLGVEDVRESPVSESLDVVTREALSQIVEERLKRIRANTLRLGTEKNVMTEGDRLVLERVIDGDTKLVDEFVGMMVQSDSVTGRQLGALNRIARSNHDPVFWEQHARKIKGGPLGQELSGTLRGLTNELNEAAATAQTAGRALNGDPAVLKAQQKLAKFVQGLRTTSNKDTIFAFRKAGLLTNIIKTGARNILGNAGFAVMNEVARPVSAMTDIAVNAVFRKAGVLDVDRRTVANLRLTDILETAKKAATEGPRRFAEIILEGAVTSELGKFDLKVIRTKMFGKAGNLLNTLIDNYVNFVGRVQVASDAPFRVAAYQSSLRSGARARALTLIKQGKAKKANLDSLTQSFVANPPDEMLAEAMFDTEIAVFANRSATADVLNKAKRIPYLGVFVELIAPFTTVPTNVVVRSLEFTPGGVAKGLAQALRQLGKGTLTAAQQKGISQSIGRGSTGSALMYTGYLLAQNDKLSPQFDSDPAIRGKRELEGRPPGSYKDDNGEWHQITGNPIGDVLVMGATIAAKDFGKLGMDTIGRAVGPGELTASDKQDLGDAGLGAGSLAVTIPFRTLSELPVAEGVKKTEQLISAVSRARSDAAMFRALTAFGATMMASFVPSVVAGGALQQDPNKRRVRPNPADTIRDIATAPFKARLPFLRPTLPFSRDASGEIVRRGNLAGIDPTNTTTERTRLPLSGLMDELGEGFRPKPRKVGQSEAQYALELQREYKQVRFRLRQLAVSQRFMNLPKIRQGPMIRAAISQARREIR